jgi:DNA-binding phage protein
VREYVAADGRSPFGIWFDRLNPEAAAKVATALIRLAGGNEGKERTAMPLTRDFKQTIRARAERDPKFRTELLREGLESMLNGDIATAKTVLRDYINATVGFTELAHATQIPSKSLMRMLGPTGNPRASNLLEVVRFLQHREGIRFRVQAARR